VAERKQRSKLDPAIPLTAAGAIFGALVGTTLLDVSNSEPAMRVVDHTTQALWIPVFLLFALLAAWPERTWLRNSAWAFAGAVAFVTAAVIFFTGFGFTRDTDHVNLILEPQTAAKIRMICPRSGISRRPYRVSGRVRTASLGTDFVIVDLDETPKHHGCKTIDIPRSSVLAFQELHH
jgi:hypothetical protein